MVNKQNITLERVKKLTFKRVLYFSLITFFIIQVSLLCYVNLTQMKFHMGYDATAFYLRSIELWKQHKLFQPEYFSHQTTFFMDTPAPLAAFLMYLFQDVFFSSGLANIIVVLFIVLFLFAISNLLKISRIAFLFLVNLFLCPFLAPSFNNANDLGYFSCVLTSLSCYSVKLLCSLIFFYTFLLLRDTNSSFRRQLFFSFFSAFLFFLQGISVGYYLLFTILFPLFVFGIIEMLLKNDVKILIKKEYLFLCVAGALSILGKSFAVIIYDFASKDSSQVWCGLQDFWKNLGSILLGYFELLAALPADSNIKILGKAGVQYVPRLGIAIAILIAVFSMFKREVWKKSLFSSYLPVFVILFSNVALFVFSYTTYGQRFFESRYLIIPFVLMLFCLAGWIDTISDDCIVKKIGCILLFILIFLTSLTSYRKYIITKINVTQMDKVKELVAKYDSPIVYFSGDRDNFLLSRNMRVYDINKVYRYIEVDNSGNIRLNFWGDYTYYSKMGDYNGNIIFLTSRDFFENKLPVNYKNKLTKIDELDDFDVYSAERNIFAMDYIGKQYKFDGNFINGGYDKDGVRYLNPQGFSFGPYCSLPNGKFCLTILGENLKAAQFDAYSEQGAVRYPLAVKEQTDEKIVLSFAIEKATSNFEILVRNVSDSLMKMSYLDISSCD